MMSGQTTHNQPYLILWLKSDFNNIFPRFSRHTFSTSKYHCQIKWRYATFHDFTKESSKAAVEKDKVGSHKDNMGKRPVNSALICIDYILRWDHILENDSDLNNFKLRSFNLQPDRFFLRKATVYLKVLRNN